MPFEVPDDESQGMVLYEQWIEEVDGTVGELSLGGWMAADMLVTGLGPLPRVQPAGLIDGLNQLTDYDFMALSADIDWTVEHEEDAPVGCSALSQIQDGASVPVFGELGMPFTLRRQRNRGPRGSRGDRLIYGHHATRQR